MKKILITGENGYIGNSFLTWIKQWQGEYEVDKISVRNDSWQDVSFQKYDVVLHTAALVHIINITADMEALYYKINCDLTVEIAKKAKREGVKQFIFLSSMSVYGESNTQNRECVIGRNTATKPEGIYGKSKLAAEKAIYPLQEDAFHIVILRPPMIYGKETKGNFPRLVKLARRTPFFPKANNARSMIYIKNLCEFIRQIIIYEEHGVYHPQNAEFINTSELVKQIAATYNKKVQLVSGLEWLISCLQRISNISNKIFGTFVYTKELSQYRDNSYQVTDFKKSLQECRSLLNK